MEKGILDVLYQVLASPSNAFRDISNKKPLRWSIITATFVAVVVSLTFLPNPSEVVEVIFDLERGSLNLILVIIPWVVIFLVALFIEGGIFHFIALLLRGRGSYLGMVCGLCFTHLPFVFFAPLSLLRALLGFSGLIIYPIGSLVIFLWILILGTTAVHQNYHFSMSRAIITYFIPGTLLYVIPLLIIFIIIAI